MKNPLKLLFQNWIAGRKYTSCAAAGQERPPGLPEWGDCNFSQHRQECASGDPDTSEASAGWVGGECGQEAEAGGYAGSESQATTRSQARRTQGSFCHSRQHQVSTPHINQY